MALVETNPSRTLVSILTNPRILSGLHFAPSPRHHPQFLANAGVVKTARRGKAAAQLLTASFVWGLRQTRKKGQPKIQPEAARRVVKRFFPKGGTIVLQLGWWKAKNEDSARIVIENRGIPSKVHKGRAMSDAEFRCEVDKLVTFVMKAFRQEEIWLDYYRGSRRVSPKKFEWK